MLNSFLVLGLRLRFAYKLLLKVACIRGVIRSQILVVICVHCSAIDFESDQEFSVRVPLQMLESLRHFVIDQSDDFECVIGHEAECEVINGYVSLVEFTRLHGDPQLETHQRFVLLQEAALHNLTLKDCVLRPPGEEVEVGLT